MKGVESPRMFTEPVIRQKTYNASEISAKSLADINHAENNGLVRLKNFGNILSVEFLDIKKSPLIPKILYHVRHPRDVEATAEGVAGEFYVQTGDLSIEPEGISIFNYSATPAIFTVNTTDLDEKTSITLDPESFGGIPGEYLHAFIIKTKNPIPMKETNKNIDTIRSESQIRS